MAKTDHVPIHDLEVDPDLNQKVDQGLAHVHLPSRNQDRGQEVYLVLLLALAQGQDLEVNPHRGQEDHTPDQDQGLLGRDPIVQLQGAVAGQDLLLGNISSKIVISLLYISSGYLTKG